MSIQKLEAFIHALGVTDPLEFVGFDPSLSSPKGYAVCLWWNAVFRVVADKPYHISLPSPAPAGMNIMEDKHIKASYLPSYWIPVSVCEAIGVPLNNIHTRYSFRMADSEKIVSGVPYCDRDVDDAIASGNISEVYIHQTGMPPPLLVR